MSNLNPNFTLQNDIVLLEKKKKSDRVKNQKTYRAPKQTYVGKPKLHLTPTLPAIGSKPVLVGTGLVVGNAKSCTALWYKML